MRLSSYGFFRAGSGHWATVPRLTQVEMLLLIRADRGLAFSSQTSKAVRSLARTLPGLNVVGRLPLRIRLLNKLAREPDPGRSPLRYP